MVPSLLHYRPWKEAWLPSWCAVLPIARVSLRMLARRKVFWVLYAFALLIFLMFFFGQYLLAWAEGQTAEQSVQVAFFRADPSVLVQLLRDALKLNGTPQTYRNFFWYQGYMVIIVLALAGTVLVGNDFQMGSLPFYLSKPLSRWHYVVGKCLAVGVFVNLMTTVPALVLYVQYGFLDSWSYFTGSFRVLLGILGYGMVLTLSLSLMTVAAASWLRKTVPLVMAWTTTFFFLRRVAETLVDGFKYDRRWKLIDFWNDAYLVGSYFLGVVETPSQESTQPLAWQAALVLAAVCTVCLIYLNLRIRAVEIVR